MTKLYLIFTCLCITSLCGHTRDVSQAEHKATEYMKVVLEQCAKPDIIDVKTSTDGYIEVELLCDGERYEIGIENNALLYRENRIYPDAILLDKISRKLEKKYQGWMLIEFSQVETTDTAFLKIEIAKDGLKQNLYFTNDGKWYKNKPITISSALDFNAIAQNKSYKSANYKFHQPDSVYEMPDILKEISGIAIYNNIVYCIQDEIGCIFEYDCNTKNIVNYHRFTDIGDFEDIAVNKTSIYVLRSDGDLFVIGAKNNAGASETMLHIPSLNIEGICFNDGFIYIASKNALINHAESQRMVYRINANKLRDIEPYLEINIDELSVFMSQNYPELGMKNVVFNPSSIAIHPITKELYILSASDRYIAIYKDKKLVNMLPLPADIYYKPEGLSFYENGDLLVSSEGDKKGFIKGTINLVKVQ